MPQTTGPKVYKYYGYCIWWSINKSNCILTKKYDRRDVSKIDGKLKFLWLLSIVGNGNCYLDHIYNLSSIFSSMDNGVKIIKLA